MNRYNSTPKPPHWAIWLLERFCAPHLLEEMRGDLEELYGERTEIIGVKQANYRYVLDVLSLARPFILKRKPAVYKSLNSFDMLSNYLLIAFRHLTKNKGYSFINIGGLAIGMTIALMIGLWIWDELSFNQYHQN